ncbi:UNVERIFIED_CONTAM: hypothetical protein GTU68_002059 [Idotea baltica]|nr:hypothetical protein [Idotea baltica]
MTYKEIKYNLKELLSKEHSEREAKNLTKLFLEYLTGLKYLQIILLEDNKAEQIVLDRYNTILPRIINSEPSQYIIGKAFFIDFELNVDNSVLIPRPETEELVRWINELNPNANKKVLDIGTGSGCIALGLKYFNSNFNVNACDVSAKAILMAKKNSSELNLAVNFFELNILKCNEIEEEYDIIVSNPPYIPTVEKELMSKNVLNFEPHIALFTNNENPLIFYKKISELAFEYLAKKGLLFFELNEFYADEIYAIMDNIGFTNIELKKDFQGKYRMIKGTK